MKRKTVSGIMLALLLIGMLTLAFNVQPVKAEPRTIVVPDDYPTIQEAINIANPGDTIYVKVGNYLEHIEIRKPIKLLGENKYNTIIYTTGYQGFWGLIEVRSTNNVTISGFSIKNYTMGIGMGIFMESCRECKISHNIILNHQYGIDMREGSNSNLIEGNVVSNCSIYGIVINRDSENNTLRNNSLVNNDMNLGVFSLYNDIDSSNTVDGKPVYYWVNQKDKQIPRDAGYVALINSTNIVVKNLTITHNQGVRLEYTNNSTIESINVSDSLRGIHLRHSHNNIITSCTLTNNTDGIRMDYSNQNNIKGNTISNNWNDGIFLSASNANIFVNNIISIDWKYSNSFSIWSHATGNLIYHNNIVHRYGRGVRVITSSPNFWDDGYPSGGNYWSDHVCTGNPSDGSQPYIIDANNIDHYPFQDPNGWLKCTLTIYSSPSGVIFTVDGVSRTTPWSGTYSEAASVSLVMPETHDGYVWSYWLEDGDTNRTKTVTMDTDITLTAVYTRPPPVGGKATPINIPMNKPETPALWIWLSTIVLSLAVTLFYVKKRKRHTEIIS